MSLKISVVTVCYNAASTIEETMLSVLNQTYDNIEYIIIDGGSTDGTVDIIKKHADRLAYWVSEPDKGIYDAMNKGIAVATGDYINFMNAGDKFYNNDILLDIFLNYDVSDKDIIYGDAIYKYSNSTIYRKPLNLNELPTHNCLFHQSMFILTRLLKENPYDISFKISADYNFSYIQYSRGASFFYFPQPIAYFEATSGISSNSVSIKMDEDLRIRGISPTLLYHIKKKLLVYKSEVRKRLAKRFPKLIEKIQIRYFVKYK